MALCTTALITAFKPGQSPPLVKIPIRLICDMVENSFVKKIL